MLNAVFELLLHPASLPVLVLIAGVIISLLYCYITNRNLPPGPTGLPYLGYWPFLKEGEIHKQLKVLADKYGDIYCFTVTGQLYVHFGSASALREAYVGKAAYLQSKCTSYSVMYGIFKNGILFAGGTHWEHLRKFFSENLNDLGDVELAYHGAVSSTVEDLKATGGTPVELRSLLLKNATHATRQIVFADYDVLEQDFTQIVQLYRECMDVLEGSMFLLAGRIPKYCILPFYGSYRKFVRAHGKLFSILSHIVDDHEESLNEDNPRNILDRFISERKQRQRKEDPATKYYTNEVLVYSLVVLIGDFSVKLAEFVTLMFYTLAIYPGEQEKVYREITEVVGYETVPSMKDRSRLHYANAFLYEVLRTSELHPYVTSLEFTSETEVGGYRIPKGAVTIFNSYAINHNSRSFTEPMKFYPSRYISTPERERSDLPLKFGAGRRSCLGEAFAMAHLFLFLVTVVQNFRLSLPPGTTTDFRKWLGNSEACVCAYPRSRD